MKTKTLLAKALRATKGTIFMGAGASFDSGLPLGDAAARDVVHAIFVETGLEQLLHQLQPDAYPSEPLRWPRFEVVLDTIANYLPDGPLEILRTFQNVGLSSTHQFLAAHISTPHLWLTTNFDNQIESALMLAGQSYITIAKRGEMIEIARKLRHHHVILKLHGDVTAGPEDLGATIDQILRTFPRRILGALKHSLLAKPTIFIGYAARDPDLRPLLKEIVKCASHVLWVGYGPESELITRLLRQGGRKCRYYDSGTLTVFQEEIGLPIPPSQRFVSWHDQVSAWARRTCARQDDRLRLLHGVAALCIMQDNPRCRVACQKILEAIPMIDEPHRSWAFQNQFRLLEQMPTGANPELAQFLEEWQLSINSEDSLVSHHTGSDAHVFLSGYFRKHGKYEQARLSAERAVSCLSPSSSSGQRITALRTLGLAQIYCGAHGLPESLKTLRRAKSLAHKLREPVLQAQATEELAFANIRSNQGKEAARLLKEAEPVYLELGDPRLLLSWQRNFAESLRMQGNVQTALRLNQEAFENAELLDDYESRRKLANNLALCRMQVGFPIDADHILDDCIQEALAKGRFEYIADPLHNRAWIRAVAADWQEAERFLLPVIELQLKRGSRERAGGSLCLLAWCRLRLGNKDAATELLARVIHENLVPAGPPRGHFLLLKLALAQASTNTDVFIRRANHRLSTFPEQRFFALSWLLELKNKELQQSAVTAIAKNCWSAVIASRESTLAAVLHSLIVRLGIFLPRATRLAIESMSPGHIDQIRQQLAAQALDFSPQRVFVDQE
jgi:tetratricopeptide (TPR) repeat protein